MLSLVVNRIVAPVVRKAAVGGVRCASSQKFQWDGNDLINCCNLANTANNIYLIPFLLFRCT